MSADPSSPLPLPPFPLGGGVHLRRAVPSDAEHFVAIKAALPMPRLPGASQTHAGGFLLGSDVEGYRAMLEVARAWLLEDDGDILGFALTFDDPVFRASSVWSRREAIEWDADLDLDIDAITAQPIAYLDQLAVLPTERGRRLGGALAIRAVDDLVRGAGHAHVLTTTVLEPVQNRAVLPYLERIGARPIGTLDEHYPEAGPIRSQLHLIDGGRFIAWCERALAKGPPWLRQLVGSALLERD